MHKTIVLSAADLGKAPQSQDPSLVQFSPRPATVAAAASIHPKSSSIFVAFLVRRPADVFQLCQAWRGLYNPFDKICGHTWRRKMYRSGILPRR